MATRVYVDGFNLYYRALKNTPYRWLDLSKLCQLLLPEDQIERIKYFTAIVKALPRDPDQPNRQRVYLRALTTIANLDIFYGKFLSHKVWMPLAEGPGFAEVIRTEEKGADVALATHLLHDAHLGKYDTAAIISNDTDLIPAIRMARHDLHKKIGLLCPQKRVSAELASEVDFCKNVRRGVLRASQFPETMSDAQGTFHKPPSW
ncbi:MAG: NYN domain-containing protein [Armatimonadota bacterium]